MNTALRGTDRLVVEVDDASQYTYTIHKPVVTVEIFDFETGLRSKGNAKCTTDDPWDEDFGVTLATVRATKRFSDKMEKYLVRSTN